MDETKTLAPAVRSILRAADERAEPEGRVSVDGRSLTAAIEASDGTDRTPIIAEVKPTSPTTDGTRTGDPVAIAREMEAGGATALSVLTEPEHFGGSTDALERVRDAVEVPVLRKDFLQSEAQLDAVAADAVLLIARFVDDLPALLTGARDRGMEALVEVHSREELAAAIDAGATLVGVNNRDLATLEVELATFERVAPDAPEDVTLVAESGIANQADARRMRAAGADALLVGTAIMDGDVRDRTRELVAA
ncbi:indole-3-glycerol phosphate synthase [Halanaeroarchaeum sulfurireducens]|uniref:Indole-3-glycerol phosphate synthase n=1 Tax=Halanaeroarchaeum sulfurireducens TaxID=1604004 RepID=A0A0F7P7D3_9EURY|nr:indole-3-glycerol phosphate synthase [Halanaeroarchaeum sulfurireducens]AKH97116.1 indole-3-glycerol-phosphate synthase [Halanaeroarchaeum sulfurireducens]ALG81517.1 indole-3-glycerol-phosphate synthase [Halanaeroarchaeum sulfurireducens]